MLRNLPGWLFCLIALLMGASLPRLLAVPSVLAPAPDLVYLDQFFAALIACAGLAGLLIAFLLRLPGRSIAATALILPSVAICTWHLTHVALEPSSPTQEHYRLALWGLMVFALSLAGIGWLGGRKGAGQRALRYLGLTLLLPWCLALLYLARLYY